ncbi:50S ribosomal protein L24 [Mesomycoplasma molare]|uniref:Large ribosomal subunit protein uL24 n=1 Tax=Mesomycoplasma molare TaxID=171288 RepID=A0ABY5TVP9_9BACT|nr:50S ribosomal protein L24 [Mesomycoplasma molare]UWD34300.1 50S ribosomal protein L24 [Mesomycoplasma molare]
MKIRKNDEVIVISGSNKGKIGQVLEVYPKTQKVIVKDVNKKTKHNKPSQTKNEGSIEVKEFPIHVSKVALLVKKATKDKPAQYSKIGYKLINGKKVRVVKKTGKTI